MTGAASQGEVTETPDEEAGTSDSSREGTVAPAALAPLAVEPAFSNLAFKEMVDLTHAPGDSGRLYVVLREGEIRVFQDAPNVDESERFLDIRPLVLTRGSEEGLLGLAFRARLRGVWPLLRLLFCAEPSTVGRRPLHRGHVDWYCAGGRRGRHDP